MTFSSFYEMSNPLTTVRKQHFWDWFSGDSVNSRWTLVAVNSGTGAMQDTVDGGFILTTGTTIGNTAYIHFADKKQYAHDGSVFIGVIKCASAGADEIPRIGIADHPDLNTSYTICGINDTGGAGFYDLRTRDGSTASSTNSTLADDASWHVHKVVTTSSDVTYTIDGVDSVDKTTNRNNIRGEPVITAHTRTSGAKTIEVRYLEAYNT
jgi:hypothetical protein